MGRDMVQNRRDLRMFMGILVGRPEKLLISKFICMRGIPRDQGDLTGLAQPLSQRH